MAGLALVGVVSTDEGRSKAAITAMVRAMPGIGRSPRSVELLSAGPGLVWSGGAVAGGPRAWAGRAASGLFVFHGRIDNRAEVADALAAETGVSDGKLAQLAWERWGEDAPGRLLGAYALVAWDEPRQELVLACDHGGWETLFYVHNQDGFFFAGNPLGLIGVTGAGTEVDEEHFAWWVLGRRYLHDRTMYRGIKRVPPSHTVRVSVDGVRATAFWQPGRQSPVRFRRDEDYVLAAREMLDRVVAPHVPERGQLVAGLSGGLDSTAVVATAARLAPGCRIASFTSVSEPDAPLFADFPGHAVDDWPNAQAVAALYPNVSTQRCPAGDVTPDEMDPNATFMAFGCPVGESSPNAWAAPRNAAMKALAPAVLLSGEGGNFTLSDYGYGRLSDLAASFRWLTLIQEAVATARTNGWSVWSTLRHHAIVRNLSPELRRAIRQLRGKHDPLWQDRVPLRPDVVANFRFEDRIAQGGKLGPQELHGSSIDQLTDQMDRFISKNFRRTWGYRALGLDLRAPLFDVRMIDFCLGLPRDQFLRKGTNRWLARRVLEDRLPHHVAWDDKYYLHCPEWLHRLTRSKPYWLPELDRLEQSPTASRLLDLARIRKLAEQWPTEPGSDQEYAYREVVARGIVAGQFLRWMQRENA